VVAGSRTKKPVGGILLRASRPQAGPNVTTVAVQRPCPPGRARQGGVIDTLVDRAAGRHARDRQLRRRWVDRNARRLRGRHLDRPCPVPGRRHPRQRTPGAATAQRPDRRRCRRIGGRRCGTRPRRGPGVVARQPSGRRPCHSGRHGGGGAGPDRGRPARAPRAGVARPGGRRPRTWRARAPGGRGADARDRAPPRPTRPDVRLGDIGHVLVESAPCPVVIAGPPPRTLAHSLPDCEHAAD